jgi:hypothetical protein
MTVFIRIALRYLAAALVARGLIDPGTGDLLSTDPDIAQAAFIVAGAASAIAAEGWYWLAKRFGLPT